MKKTHLLLIDGMALFFRAFYATARTGQFMFNHQGVPTNGVQGFLQQLLLAVQDQRPTHVAVCWDTGKKTFRHRLFNGYKANRPPAPPEMVPQFSLARRMTEVLQIPNVDADGFEADDCIGTIAAQVCDQADVSILTGDRDLLQLLAPRVTVRLLRKGYGNYAVYTERRFIDRHGIIPRAFIDVKALMGDASDGYAGVKGIGEKTAMKLIRRFKSIKGVLEHLDMLPDGQEKKIAADVDKLRLSRTLAEINCAAPVLFSMSDAVCRGVPDSFYDEVRSRDMNIVLRDLIRMRQLRTEAAIDTEQTPFNSGI